MPDLKSLINGTDIRGIAKETEEFKVNLDDEVISLLGKGFLVWLMNKYNNKKITVAIGHDSRITANKIKVVLIDVLLKYGVEVYDCGLSTTPAMFMTTVVDKYKCNGAIMITASHLQYYYNGIKFFTKDGGCEKDDIEEIVNLSYKDIIFENRFGQIKRINLIDYYSNLLVEKVREGVKCNGEYNKPLSGKRVILDAGNGAGGFFSEKVLKELGADIKGSQFLFEADLGIIFDTDVDRVAVVAKNGQEINKNSLIALISAILLKENQGSTIVTDSVTSNGLTDFIYGLGGKHHRFKRGYRNVINEAKRLNELGVDCPIAVESSGHAALRENYFLDDGAYLVIKIIVEMVKLNEKGKDILSVINELKYPVDSKEIRRKINTKYFRKYGQNITSKLYEYTKGISGWSIDGNNFEGIKVNCKKEKGWFLVRVSLHELLLVINIESDLDDGIKVIVNRLSKYLDNYSYLENMQG